MCWAPCGHTSCAWSFRILHPSAAHSPTELSVGEGLLEPSMRQQGEGKYPRDSAAVLDPDSCSRIFIFSFLLLALCLPSAAPGVSRYIPQQFCFKVLTQDKACGLERERYCPLVTAEQVILFKPGACSHFPGWKLPLQSAGADAAVTSTGETPFSKQGARQPNENESWA